MRPQYPKPPQQCSVFGGPEQDLSTAGSDHGGRRCGEATDAACSGGGFAEADDLLVLCGEAGQVLGAELRQAVDGLFCLGQSLPEPGILRLEAGDPGFAGVGDVSGLLQGLQPALELGAWFSFPVRWAAEILMRTPRPWWRRRRRSRRRRGGPVVVGLKSDAFGLSCGAEPAEEDLVRSACSAQTGRWQG